MGDAYDAQPSAPANESEGYPLVTSGDWLVKLQEHVSSAADQGA
jgi:hypothetical protein